MYRHFLYERRLSVPRGLWIESLAILFSLFVLVSSTKFSKKGGEDAFWSLSWEIAILNDRTKEEERFATAGEATNALSPQKAEILTLDWSQSLCSSDRNTTESSNMQTVQCSRILMCFVGTVHFPLRPGVKGDSVSENTTRCLYLPNRLILERSRLNVHMCFPERMGFGWVHKTIYEKRLLDLFICLPVRPRGSNNSAPTGKISWNSMPLLFQIWQK